MMDFFHICRLWFTSTQLNVSTSLQYPLALLKPCFNYQISAPASVFLDGIINHNENMSVTEAVVNVSMSSLN